MPYDVIRQSDNLESSPFGHLRKPLGLRLIFKRVAWEIDTWKSKAKDQKKIMLNSIFSPWQLRHGWKDNSCSKKRGGFLPTVSMNVRLDENADTTYTIKIDFHIFVFVPIAHPI